jgi:hypothetical protein
MSLPKLYLETTILSYLTARRSLDLRLAADQQATQEWWEVQRGEYDLYVSAAVLAEAGESDPVFAAKRLAVLDGIPELRVSDEVTALAARLLFEQIISVIAEVDAAHLAFSAVHGLDFLLTWNCKHIHNLKLERRIEAACRSLGFTCPIICTPAELLGN